MDIIQILLVQHRLILQTLHHLEKLNKLPANTFNTACAKEMLYVIADLAAKHSRLEEKYLFPELSRQGDKKLDYVHVMEFEHGQIFGILSALEGAKNEKLIHKEVDLFVTSIRNHFAKEEKVYFPYARKKIDKKILEGLGSKCGAYLPTFTAKNP